nr:DNA repair protein RadC [uncultured Allomuricauda sp.]
MDLLSGNQGQRTRQAVDPKEQREGHLFDVHMIDRIILAPDGSYYSFADNRIL